MRRARAGIAGLIGVFAGGAYYRDWQTGLIVACAFVLGLCVMGLKSEVGSRGDANRVER